MAKCLNTNTMEYRQKLRMSGMSEFSFRAFTSKFVESNGRYPELDELPNANSQPYLEKALEVTNNEGISAVQNDKILEYTQSSSISEANIALNNLYRDLEIKLLPIIKKSVIEVKERPTKFRSTYNNDLLIDTKVDPSMNLGVMNNIVERLSSLYGINFIAITNEELSTSKWDGIVDDAKSTNAFIYNGDVYINLDNAKIDAPVHELLHMILGSMRFTDPSTYYGLVDAMEGIPMYESRAQEYKNRTRSDINEELFVSEMAKYLTGQSNVIKDLDKQVLNRVFYHMNRVLDSSIFGVQSVSTMDTGSLFRSSIVELCSGLGSELTNKSYIGTIDKASAENHRVMANAKSDLMREGKLKEFCG